MVSITSYTQKCKTTLGGIKKIYLFPFVKYTRSQIVVNGMELITFPETYIYEFDVIGSYNQTSDIEGGDIFFNQSFTANLNVVYNVLDIQNLLLRDYRCIIETNNGDKLLLGTYNGLRGTATNGSGQSKNEFNGFKVDFTGKENVYLLRIEDLATAGFIINTGNNLNYTLNFNI